MLTHLKKLESVDLTFFRNLFDVPNTTVPSVSLYLETGSISIGTIIKVRRVIFLQYLLKLDSSEMLSKFFWAQWENPIKFDWTLEVRKNLKEFGVTNNIEEIKIMSKYSF